MAPRRSFILHLCLTLNVACLGWTPVADAAQAFINPRAIVVPDATEAGPGLAPVAASTITVAGQANPANRVRHVQVILPSLVHPRVQDLDILLVPPAGSGRPAVLLMSDVPVTTSLPWSYRFSDEASLTLTANPSTSTYYKPTDLAPADLFPGLAPMPITTDLSALIGMDPVGDWQLWVVDDQPGQTGGLLEGWTLSFNLGDAGAQPTPQTIDSPASAGTVVFGTPSGTAIPVSGVSGRITWVRVTLQGLTHPRPADLEFVLRAPGGTCFRLLRDVGGATPVSNIDVAIDMRNDGTGQSPYARAALDGPLTAGIFAATENYDSADTNVLSSDIGCNFITSSFIPQQAADATGNWTLFVADDGVGADGSLAGWTLEYAQELDFPTLVFNAPPSLNVPTTSMVLSGSTYSWGDSAQLEAVRWRMTLRPNDDYEHYSQMPTYEAVGPWVPLPNAPSPNAAWSLTDVPKHWGVGALCVDGRTTIGTIRASCTSVDMPQPAYTLSEGATGTFFDLDIAIFNPTDAAAHADVQFLKSNGEVITQAVDLGPKQRRRIEVDAIPGLEGAEVSTIVRPSTVTPLVVERAMFWDATRYGGHAANATEPATSWYFAEGAQGFYRTYILLANPNDDQAHVTLRFLIEGGKPKDHTITIPPHTRQTIDAGSIPSLVSQAFGITITSSRKIVAERAMYFSGGSGRLWEGGHESTGVARPARAWLLAEGATGTFFTTFVLVSNPSSWDTEVTMEFLKEDGSLVRKKYPLAAYGRLSVNIRGEHPSLSATGVSTYITSNSDIVVERAMYWPGSPLEWTEAHNGFGITAMGPKWGLADGRVGGPLGYATYILLANTGDDPAFANVLFALDGGQQITRTFRVEPHSRLTIDAAAALGLDTGAGIEFSNVITTDADTPIAVERATYWNSTDGRHWAGGNNVQGTRLP